MVTKTVRLTRTQTPVSPSRATPAARPRTGPSTTKVQRKYKSTIGNAQAVVKGANAEVQKRYMDATKAASGYTAERATAVAADKDMASRIAASGLKTSPPSTAKPKKKK